MSQESIQKEPLQLTKDEWLLVADALDYCAQKSIYLDVLKQLRSIIERIEEQYGVEI